MNSSKGSKVRMIAIYLRFLCYLLLNLAVTAIA
jgi:hypothetical protein